MLNKIIDFLWGGILGGLCSQVPYPYCLYQDDGLQPIERQVIKLRAKGKTQKEISELTGLTINQVKSKIQKLLKAGIIQRVKA